MYKLWRTLSGIFVIFIVFCYTLTAYGQQTNPGSPVLQYTGKVNIEELVNNINKLITNVDTLTKNQDLLIQDVKEVRETMIRIDERTENTKTLVLGGVITIIGGLIVAVIIQTILVKRKIKEYIPGLLLQSQKLESTEQEKPKDSSSIGFNYNDNVKGEPSNA